MFSPAVSSAPLDAELVHGAGEAEAVHEHADRADDARLVDVDLVGGRRRRSSRRSADVLDHHVQRRARDTARAGAAISSLMWPACTGLPPGLLMRRMTPCVLAVLERRLQPPLMRSALASASGAITPSSSTSAVCLPVGGQASPCRGRSSPATRAARAKQIERTSSSLKRMPQWRARRCSSSASSATVSRTARSQLAGAGRSSVMMLVASTDIPGHRALAPASGSSEASAARSADATPVSRLDKSRRASSTSSIARSGRRTHPGCQSSSIATCAQRLTIGVRLSVVADRRSRLFAAVTLDVKRTPVPPSTSAADAQISCSSPAIAAAPCTLVEARQRRRASRAAPRRCAP